MEVFLEGGDEDEEMDEDEGELLIEGEPRREAETVFVDKLTNGFALHIKNLLALTSSFKWAKILEWKRIQEDFTHEDQELQVLVTAEGALRQIYDLNFKVKP